MSQFGIYSLPPCTGANGLRWCENWWGSKELIFVCGVEIGTVIPVGRRLEE